MPFTEDDAIKMEAAERLAEQQPGYRDTFGGRLRAIRAVRNLRLEDVAREAEISKSYLSDLERGNQDNPTMKVLQALCAALGVTPHWLVHGVQVDRDALDGLPGDEPMGLRNYAVALTEDASDEIDGHRPNVPIAAVQAAVGLSYATMSLDATTEEAGAAVVAALGELTEQVKRVADCLEEAHK